MEFDMDDKNMVLQRVTTAAAVIACNNNDDSCMCTHDDIRQQRRLMHGHDNKYRTKNPGHRWWWSVAKTKQIIYVIVLDT